MLSPVLARYTGYLVRRAQQVHAALWAQEIDSDITSVQFGVLSLLKSNPGIDQRSLGELLQLDRSTIADLVSRLEGRGLIERVRDVGDRRRKILTLTRGGAVQLEDLWEHADRVNERLVGGLGDRDRAELNRLLGILVESAVAEQLVAEDDLPR